MILGYREESQAAYTCLSFRSSEEGVAVSSIGGSVERKSKTDRGGIVRISSRVSSRRWASLSVQVSANSVYAPGFRLRVQVGTVVFPIRSEYY